MQLSTSPDSSPARDADRLAAAKVIGEAIRDLATMRRQLERENVCDASIASLTVLSTLERHGPSRVSEVAELVDVDLSVASRHTTALEQRGLVVREPSADDRRAHLISVTDAGRATLAQARAWIADRLEASLASWSTERLTAVAESLAELRADMSAFIRSPDPQGATLHAGGPNHPQTTTPLSLGGRTTR